MFANKQTLIAMAFASPALAMKAAGYTTGGGNIDISANDVSEYLTSQGFDGRTLSSLDDMQNGNVNAHVNQGSNFTKRAAQVATNLWKKQNDPQMASQRQRVNPNLKNRLLPQGNNAATPLQLPTGAVQNGENLLNQQPDFQRNGDTIVVTPAKKKPKKSMSKKALIGGVLALGGGITSAYCLAQVGQETAVHDHVFTRFFSGTEGNIMAGAIIFCVAMGFALLVASVAPKWTWALSVFMFLGSGCFMTGLNMIQTHGVENLGDSLNKAFNLANTDSSSAAKFVQSPQFLLVTGISVMGLVLLVSLFLWMCKSKQAAVPGLPRYHDAVNPQLS